MDRWRRVNREIVENDDEAALGPVASEGLQQLEELVVPPLPADMQHHATTAHVPARENGQRSMPAILVLDPQRLTGAQRPPRVQPFENLHLRFLVYADDARPLRRSQVPAHDPAHLAPKLRVGAVEPPLDPMGFEGRGLQPSCDRALAERRPGIAPTPRGLRQRAQGPVRPRGCQLLQGMLRPLCYD